MNLTITDNQYKLIRSALEHYYYICKDDGELYHKLEEINELESELIKQSK